MGSEAILVLQALLMEVEMKGMEAIEVPIILVLLNPLDRLQETLTLLCLIIIAEEVKSMKKR